MATIVSSAAGPPPPPPPPPPLPPNWKPTDRPYLANHAKTKRRKKDEKAQKKATHNARVSTVWRLLHQQGTTPDVVKGSQAWVTQASSRCGQVGCGRATGCSGFGESGYSFVDPVSGEAGNNVEAEPTEPAVEESQGHRP
ncbi:uncharacterized protein N7487_005535 [Penicillium crustosum]|uniref:uncharacterized protein n=1 Tax=Penicillium crustosum TaxID=36656 RepID=UPI00239A85B2|nr:uncharacterized protein N7487_005535 [Penicillium crustosum]KAJ5411176.1 hypothetical protein N7487_005535 [Penicillium crustosum]